MLDIAEEEEKMFKFTISLLGTIIQDGGMKERSNVKLYYNLNSVCGWYAVDIVDSIPNSLHHSWKSSAEYCTPLSEIICRGSLCRE